MSCQRSIHVRRGAVSVVVAVFIVVAISFAALSIDIGMLQTVRAELQASADAAALASSRTMISDERLKSALAQQAVFTATRNEAAAYALKNLVQHEAPTLDLNVNNAIDGDVVLGYIQNPFNQAETLSTASPNLFNSVRVRVRRDDQRNGAIDFIFGRFLGRDTKDMWARATATFQDGIVGFKATAKTGNAELMPFALHVSSWANLLSGAVHSGDHYSYDPDSGVVSDGPDGIFELNLYPGAGSGQLPPGNFGTVDIGSSNNSTADISRQIRYGVSASDLAYHGGQLRLGPDGTLLLNGDTGLSAAVKDDLEAIKGEGRVIPLFSSVSGPGNNAMYTIVGFAGIRVVNVKLTGSMNSKRVVVQPAYVVDDSGIAEAGGNSYFVYRPPILSR